MNRQQLLRSTLIGTAVTIAFVVIITIAGELYKVVGADGKSINPIKEFLKALHGHHWVGKGIWATGLFIIASAAQYLVFRKNTTEHSLAPYVTLVTWSLILGTLVLFGFFTYEFVIHH